MSNLKHGDRRTRLYSIWCGIKTRCYNKDCQTYKNYGAKGIKVCKKWFNSYLDFKEWSLKNGYKDILTIDRIDNNKDYCPENCKWSTKTDQSRNRSTTKLDIKKVKKIKLLLKENSFSQEEIAKMFNVERTTIGKINVGKNWKDV